MSPKWTKTEIEIEITLCPYRPNDVYHLYRQSMVSSEHILKFSLQSALFLSHMATRILSSTLSFFCMLKVLKCEAVNFSTSPSTHVNGRQIIKLQCHKIREVPTYAPCDAHMTS